MNRCIILLGLVLGGVFWPHASTRADYCEVVNCSRECWWVAPGHRRCATRCLRRCWRPAPRYEAPDYQPPLYEPPVYTQPVPAYTPSYSSSSSPPDPALVLAVLGGILAVIIGLIGAAVSATEDPIAREIAKIDETEETTRSANALADQARATTHAIDDFIALKEQDAARRGREAADREWEEFTRHE